MSVNSSAPPGTFGKLIIEGSQSPSEDYLCCVNISIGMMSAAFTNELLFISLTLASLNPESITLRRQAIAIPGHTASHMVYLVNKTHLLTGDTLLIRGCGRTDFQGGDAGMLYDVVMEKLFTLPDETLVYPAHDYKGRTVSTIGEEKRSNPRFTDRTRSQFITIMNNFNLSYPKKMNQAVPANEYCGDFISEEHLNPVVAATENEQTKAELTLLMNTEIHDYFAMYI